MSKNIIIQETGIDRELSADKIVTARINTGSVVWSDEKNNTVELYIFGDGTYKAANFGAYGISKVTVYGKRGGGSAVFDDPPRKYEAEATIAIQEGGKQINLTARALKTNLQGGGTCTWEQLQDTTLKTKYITEEGVYTAQEDDCFAWSEITVSGIDSGGGGGGGDYGVPDYITTHGPIDITYNDGEEISRDFKVYAYKDGEIWTGGGRYPDGIIPQNELTLTPRVASFDYTYGGADTLSHNFELWQVNTMPVSYGTGGTYWPNIAVWSYVPAVVSFDAQGMDAQTGSPITLQYNSEKCVYAADIDLNGSSQTPDYGPVYRNDDEWWALIPDGCCIPSTEMITVSWTRPDGYELVCSFWVFVNTPQ